MAEGRECHGGSGCAVIAVSRGISCVIDSVTRGRDCSEMRSEMAPCLILVRRRECLLSRSCLLLLLIGRVNSKAAPPKSPWIVGTDWDDTVKAGGNGKLFGIRGVGRRIRGTYPGITTLLAELDECGSVDVHFDKKSFQVWSANPFSSKKPQSCKPPLHRKPVTRRGPIHYGLCWVAANSVPTRFVAIRRWCLEHAAAGLGDGKYRAFCRAAKAAGDESTEILFIGDAAQGDELAARRML